MSITLCLLLFFYIVILCCAFLAWCDVDAFIAFFCGEYWVGCLMLFYQVSGHGLCLRLTDGCLFFCFVYFCVSVGVGFLRWIKLRLVPCFFCYKNYT